MMVMPVYRYPLAISCWFILFLVPCAVAASQFEGKLFYTVKERIDIDLKHEAATMMSASTDSSLIKPASSISKTEPVSFVKTLILSFDGIMGDEAFPSLWINRRPWNDSTDIKGITGLRWNLDRERLLVNLDDGREVFLKVGQCLLESYELIPCASLPDEH